LYWGLRAVEIVTGSDIVVSSILVYLEAALRLVLLPYVLTIVDRMVLESVFSAHISCRGPPIGNRFLLSLSGHVLDPRIRTSIGPSSAPGPRRSIFSSPFV